MSRSTPRLLLTLLIVLRVAIGCAGLNHPAPKNTDAIYASLPEDADADPDDRGLRVMTYNVHMEPADDIARSIRSNEQLAQADVLLFQEIEDHHDETQTRAQMVATELSMSFAYAPGYALPRGGSHGVAILSKYPLGDVEIIELPYYGVVVNSARRVALAVTIELGGQRLRIYSVHLDNRINPSKRQKQIAPVFAAADLFVGPVIIAGDLNTSPFCWLGSLVPIPCGLQDNAVERSARNHGFAVPLANSGPTAKWLAMRLDAIYIRELVPGARAVERTVRLSDHLPVWLDVQL